MIATMTAGFLSRKILKSAWKQVEHKEPPEDRRRNDVPVWETILWTAISGLIASFSRLLVRQTAEWAGEKYHFDY